MDPIFIGLIILQIICLMLFFYFIVKAYIEEERSRKVKSDALKKFADALRKNNP